jgi:hypothetical protein
MQILYWAGQEQDIGPVARVGRASAGPVAHAAAESCQGKQCGNGAECAALISRGVTQSPPATDLLTRRCFAPCQKDCDLCPGRETMPTANDQCNLALAGVAYGVWRCRQLWYKTCRT